jgi:hypothetical protein
MSEEDPDGSRADTSLEVLALRQQVVVLKRSGRDPH